MRLNNIIEEYPDLNITVKVGDLKEWADYIIGLTRQELEQQVANEKSETYLSRAEVAKMLGVNKSTLWRWNKQGYLLHIETGSKRKYKMSDIKRILGEGRNGKN